MWGVLLVVCTLLPSLICKEYAPAVGLADDEKTILSRIMKRLELEENRFGKGSQPKRVQDDGRHGDESGCGNVIVKNATIIDTNASISKGALYLEVFRHVSSNKACVDHCCKNSSCDTVVFENKDEHRCFLFHCRGSCSYSQNVSFHKYIYSEIDRRIPSAPTPLPISETAAVGLDLDPDAILGSDHDVNESSSDRDDGAIDSGKSSESVGLKRDNITATLAPSVVTSAAPTVAATHILPHSVSLGGICHDNLHCKDTGAECNSQKCLCRRGFQKKDNVCREECPVDSFQCGNPGDGNIQCVSKEKVCDSIKQCADGSDEYNCTDSEKQGQSDSKHSSEEEKPLNTGEGKPEEQQHSSEEQTPSNSEEEKQEENQPASEEENQSSSEEKLEEENQHGSEKESDTSSKEETQEKNPVGSDEEAIDSTHPSEDRSTTDIAITDVTTTTAAPHDSFISWEKVAQTVKEGNLQVPIIALSVGLAFTLILLLFVACRLCRVRRKLRKSRPLHCNEADYLINGMYL